MFYQILNTMKIFSYTLLFLVVSSIGNYAFSNDGAKKNAIIFMEIDDRADVYVDGKKVFSKATAYGTLGEEVEFDLNPFLVEGQDQTVEIRVVNHQCNSCSSNNWKVVYEVFQDGESVDFLVEEGESKGETQEVFSMVYDWWGM